MKKIKPKSTSKSKVTKKTVLNKQISFGMTPLQDRVILKPIVSEDLVKKTASGIIIPDTVSKEKPEQGVVVAVGEGKVVDGKLVKVALSIGDRVVFSRYGYDEVKHDDEDFYIVKEENILAVIK